MSEATDKADKVPAEDRPSVVIAGGSGFIGRRLSAVLGGAGYRVTILTRQAVRPPVGPVHFVRWDGGAGEARGSWQDSLEGVRAVVNLCGQSIGGRRWTEARKAELIRSRVAPTEALVRAVNQATRPPEVFLQASGVGYYGTGEPARTEGSGAGDDFLADLACRWEQPLTALRDDVRAAVVRFGVVLAKDGGALPQMLLPFRLFVGGPIANGRQWLSWIHLHDAAAALIRLIEEPDTSGIYNVTAPQPVRNAEFARLAGQALGRPTWLFTPRSLLKVLLGEQSTLLCDGQQVLPERLEALGFRFSYPSLEDAFEVLVP